MSTGLFESVARLEDAERESLVEIAAPVDQRVEYSLRAQRELGASRDHFERLRLLAGRSTGVLAAAEFGSASARGLRAHAEAQQTVHQLRAQRHAQSLHSHAPIQNTLYCTAHTTNIK